MRWKAEEKKMHQEEQKMKKARDDCRETFMDLSGNGKKKKKKEKRNTIKKSARIKKQPRVHQRKKYQQLLPKERHFQR